MFLHVSANLIEFRRPEAVIGGDRYRLKPEFHFDIVAGYVNVRPLTVLPALEMKPVRADAEHGWHGANEGWKKNDQPAAQQRFTSEVPAT